MRLALVSRCRSTRLARLSSRAASSSIDIVDDFFPAQTQEQILKLMERPQWSFTGGRAPNQFWHMDYLEREPFFRDELVGRICEKLGRSFGVERIYANGQTALQHGAPHEDDGDVTFLYYPNPYWQPDWRGSLLFLSLPTTGRRTHIPPPSKLRRYASHIVDYKPNRAVLFPTRGLIHCAEAPSQRFTGLRVSLAFKLLLR